MFKILHNKKAQANISEYALIFIIAIAMTSGMAVYFKRGIQARLYAGRNQMLRTVLDRTNGYYNEGLAFDYNPYYTNSTAVVSRSAETKTELLPIPGSTSGLFIQTVNEITRVEASSKTAPPKDAD